MKKNNLPTFAASIIFVVIAGLHSVSAQDVITNGGPAGSYTGSCNFVQTINNVSIIAKCREINHSFLDIGGDSYADARLNNFFTCKRDSSGQFSIINKDGVLCCTRSLETAEFKAAYNAFNIASTKVAGQMAVFEKDSKGNADLETQYWLIEYFRNGFGANYTPLFNTGSPGVFTTVRDYVRIHTELHQSMVDNAFGEVYKRDPKPEEWNEWKDKIANGKDYAEMVIELKKKKAKEDATTMDDGTLPSN